jgi:hypothetical protein
MLLHSVVLRPQLGSEPPKYNDPTHLNALLSGLEAGKRFLDALLSFPAHEYYLISFLEWMRLPTVIMTVARLCMPSDAHSAAGWDVKAAQDRVRLDLCLESLCYRTQQLSTYDKVKQTVCNVYVQIACETTTDFVYAPLASGFLVCHALHQRYDESLVRSQDQSDDIFASHTRKHARACCK